MNQSNLKRMATLLFAALCLSVGNMFAQSVSVSGVVQDAAGESVIGAYVIQQGTQNAAVTGLDGTWTLSVPAGARLEVSCIGYQEKTVTVGNDPFIVITLEEDMKILEESVVVGYGIQKKANLTGAVASVSSKDIADIPAANAASLLQGRLPGVVLTSNGGQAGKDSPQIRIRGIGTFGNNEPMVLIDGVEASVDQIQQIAASDIDNVSVLKDAASASIYGVRAANGVILITTKRGAEAGKPTVTYNGSVSAQMPTIIPEFVHSYDWAKMYNESHNAEFYTADMLQKLQDGSDPDHFADTRWAEEIFRTAPMTQHNLSISGGSANVHYMTSVGYVKQEGIMKATGYQRFNFRSNLDAKLGIFKMGLNVSGSKDDIKEPASGVTSENGAMRMLTWFTRPTVPVKHKNGYYAHTDGTTMSHTIFKNPVEDMEMNHKTNDRYFMNVNAFAEVDIVKGLKFRTSLAYKLFMNNTQTYYQSYKRFDAEGNQIYDSPNNSLSQYHYLDRGWLNENILTYNERFGKHEIGILAGHSAQENRNNFFTGYRQGFATDNLYELNAGTQNDAVTGSATEYALQSFFGRINYNYDNRYLLEFNVRRDGSSRMPKSHRYATFPSVSAGWVITNEGFMPQLDWMNYLKLRASYGILGNQEIGDYQYSPTLAANYNYYFGDNKVIGMTENIVANDNIKWETTRITDFGVDAAFFKGKVNVNFDWFDKYTYDILLRLPMPSTYLGSLRAPYQNSATVRNRGWELVGTYFDHKGDLSWNAGFNVSHVKNTIVDNKGIDDIIGDTINKENYPIGSYYGLKAIGIYRTEADLGRTNSKGVVITQNGAAPQLGDIMYEDIDDSGNIDTDGDRTIIGNPFPTLTYSFNFGLGWKGFDFTMFWQGVAGVYRYFWEQTELSNGGNMSARWLDRWSPANPNGSMPSLGKSFDSTYSSFWLEKADYLRLKNVELGYTFDKRKLSKIGVSNLRVYLQATNPLIITGVKYYDPEKSSGDSRGDFYPNVKSYSLGVSVNF